MTEVIFERINPIDVADRVAFYISVPGGSKTIHSIVSVYGGGFLFCFA